MQEINLFCSRSFSFVKFNRIPGTDRLLNFCMFFLGIFGLFLLVGLTLVRVIVHDLR